MATQESTCAPKPDDPIEIPGLTRGERVTDVDKLQYTIEMMDGLTQEALSEIQTVARMLLRQLEYRTSIEEIAVILEAIAGRAERVDNDTHDLAEQVGCHWINDGLRRRLENQIRYERGLRQ